VVLSFCLRRLSGGGSQTTATEPFRRHGQSPKHWDPEQASSPQAGPPSPRQTSRAAPEEPRLQMLDHLTISIIRHRRTYRNFHHQISGFTIPKTLRSQSTAPRAVSLALTLEGRVFDLIRDVMLDAGMLRRCIDRGKSGESYEGHIAREMSQVAEASKAAADKRRRLMEQYALEQCPQMRTSLSTALSTRS
jgi:hypothetical protein